MQDFDRMEDEGSPGSIVEAVARQAYLHLNIEVSQERCCDMVMNVIMDYFAKYFDQQVIFTEEIHKEIKSETLQTSTVDSVLEAAASLFQSKIIFHSDSGSLEFKMIEPTVTSEFLWLKIRVKITLISNLSSSNWNALVNMTTC